MKSFVAYYRVSTNKQGKSGLGLEAQRESVSSYLNLNGGTIREEYIEIESGGKNDRPELSKALKLCRSTKFVLIIAKLDRLARNVHFISGLMEAGVEFVAVDNPHANRLMLHMLAAFAEHEREQISLRTKAALAAAKARGVKLGANGAVLAKQNKKASQEFALKMKAVIDEVRGEGKTLLREIADELNLRGIETQMGGAWHPMTVSRIVRRIDKKSFIH